MFTPFITLTKGGAGSNERTDYWNSDEGPTQVWVRVSMDRYPDLAAWKESQTTRADKRYSLRQLSCVIFHYTYNQSQNTHDYFPTQIKILETQ
jgi:hypothetical protein